MAANQDQSTSQQKPHSFWELVWLSVFLPGAGQYFTGQQNKCLAIAIPSAILFVDIMVHTFIVAQMVFAPVMAGEPMVIREEVFLILRTLLIHTGLAILLWIYALVDTIITAKRLNAQ
ncbi:MAG: hypothetical protein OEV92_03035 [Nitrospinota bacterium]|nr:hypothetical protein [Nitrospinota bacterium]